MARIKLNKARDILSYEEQIKSGSNEEMLFNLIKSFENNHFGWKRDKMGYYRELFLSNSRVKYLRTFLKVSKVKKTEFEDHYLVRLLRK